MAPPEVAMKSWNEKHNDAVASGFDAAKCIFSHYRDVFKRFPAVVAQANDAERAMELFRDELAEINRVKEEMLDQERKDRERKSSRQDSMFEQDRRKADQPPIPDKDLPDEVFDFDSESPADLQEVSQLTEGEAPMLHAHEEDVIDAEYTEEEIVEEMHEPAYVSISAETKPDDEPTCVDYTDKSGNCYTVMNAPKDPSSWVACKIRRTPHSSYNAGFAPTCKPKETKAEAQVELDAVAEKKGWTRVEVEK